MFNFLHSPEMQKLFEFYSRFKFKIVNKNYYTRSESSNFVIPFYRTKIREVAIACIGPKTWNLLSNELKSCETVSKFKNLYKEFLLNKYLPSA